MKRKLAICLAAILSVGVLASCAEQKATNDADGDGIPFNSIEDTTGKKAVLLNTPSEQERTDIVVEEDIIEAPILADTISEVISTIKSGRADYAILFTPSAKYFAAGDPTLGYIQAPTLFPDAPDVFAMNYTVAMTTRAEDTELLGRINSAISELKADGTLDNLYKNFIDGLNVAATDPIPVIDGAQTIKVGITGDNPPFDYIDPTGNPQGFNVELMKAIAAKAGINGEFVTIASNARFAALESGRTDVHFFGTGIPADIKDGYTMTEAYAAEVTMSHLYVK
jgi:ABC-type amino acid transport substrate-binding protein